MTIKSMIDHFKNNPFSKHSESFFNWIDSDEFYN